MSDRYETRPYRALWSAVLIQAFRDAGHAHQRCVDQRENYHRAAAAAWLSGDTSDLRDVCDRAGVSHHTVRRTWGERSVSLPETPRRPVGGANKHKGAV